MKKPNDKTQALKYLLLRHLRVEKNYFLDEDFIEVSKSLDVFNVNGEFQVSYRNRGNIFTTTYSEKDFFFYIRGDRENSLNNSVHEINNIKARQFVNQIKTKKINDFNNNKDFLERFRELPVYILLSINSLFFYFFTNNIFFSTSLIIFYILDKFRLNLSIVALSFFLYVFYFGGHLTSLFGLFFFIIIKSLDSNFYFYKTNIFLALVLFSFFLFLNIKNNYLNLIDLDIIFLGIFFISLIIFTISSLQGSNLSKFKLIFPLLSVGIYLDFGFVLSLSHLIISVVFICYSYFFYKIIPIQKENKLTPNG